MNIEQIYRDYLKDIKLMQLATVEGDTPWLCNVWYVMDGQNNIFWISRDTRKHSIDLKNNPKAACTFHKSFDQGLMKDKGQALVISGKARQLSGEECRIPYEIYCKRFTCLPEFQSLEAFLNNEGHHFFYQLTPDKIVWWDEVNFPDSPRQEVK